MFKSVVLAFAIVTVMASGIAAHAGVSRLMYVMGRDGVLPKRFFGHISPKGYTPSYNIWLAGVVCLSAGFLSLEFVVALISFGALTAFSFVNLSVISSYGFRDGRLKRPKDVWQFFVLPLLGFAGALAAVGLTRARKTLSAFVASSLTIVGVTIDGNWDGVNPPTAGFVVPAGSSRRAGKKMRKNAATMPGRTSGSTTSRRACHMLAPQARAASTSESCTCSSAAELALSEKAM